MRSALLVQALLLSCGGGSGASPDAPLVDTSSATDAPLVDAPEITITGRLETVMVDETGEDAAPVDLSSRTVQIILADGTIRPGITSGGTFSIAGVPAGEKHLLEVDYQVPILVESSASDVRLSAYSIGRRGAIAAGASTTLAVTANQLTAWQVDDMFIAYSTNGLHTAGYEQYMTPAPTVGATVLDAQLDYAPDLLIEGSKGDPFDLLHLRAESAGGVPVLVLADAFHPVSFDMTDGANTHVAGSFTHVARSNPLPLRWKRSAWAAARASVHPTAVGVVEGFDISAQPGGTAHGDLDDRAELVFVTPAHADTDLDLGTLMWGTAFPSSYASIATVEHQDQVTYDVGGQSYALVARYRASTIASALALPLTPELGPVQQVKVDGADAFGALAGVGTSPTISWQPPALGAPTNYVVTVIQLSNGQPRTVGAIVTTSTSVKLPPILGLATGDHVVFRVRAEVRTGVDVEAAPLDRGLPYRGCEMLTNVATI